MEMSFSNIGNRKQTQRKKKNFINIMQSYLLPHTQTVKKKRNMFTLKKTKKLLFQLINLHPHPHTHTSSSSPSSRENLDKPLHE